jgi:hypothetical protein
VTGEVGDLEVGNVGDLEGNKVGREVTTGVPVGLIVANVEGINVKILDGARVFGAFVASNPTKQLQNPHLVAFAKLYSLTIGHHKSVGIVGNW